MVQILTESKNRLFLLDGMALIYRAHFALIRSPRFTSSGLCTSAVFGFTNTLLDILQKQSPTHIAAAFDTSAPTQRHVQYPEYKATRDRPPEDLSLQFPLVDRLLEAMNITVIRSPGYEADDIIGTLAREAEEKEDFTTWMVTPDKDLQQLVSDKSIIYKPGRKGSEHEMWGEDEILDRWKIQRVDQVIDILGLMGDSSDNIPGIPGIGEKTAQKLIQQFASVENLILRSDELKGRQKQLVQEYQKQALLSKQLVTIDRDVPIDISLDDLKVRSHDPSRLKQLFQELEFDALGKRIFGNSFSSAGNRAKVVRQNREKEIQRRLFGEPVEEKTIQDVPHDYQLVCTADERAALIAKLKAQSAICFDTEATSRDPRTTLPLGVAFCFEPHSAYYVLCGDDPAQAQQVLEQLRPVLEDASIEKTGHNLKYDLTLLKWHGVEVRGRLMDTLLAHSMKEPEMRHGRDYLARLYLGYKPIPISQLLNQPNEPQKSMRDVPIEQVVEYACEDADITLQIANVIRSDIQRRGVGQVCHEVECPLVPVLVDMEYEGIRLDVAALKQCSGQLQAEIARLQAGIFQAAGHEFNIDSPKQLGVVLFDELQLNEKPKKTATGQFSTREPELERLAGRHQIVRDVLEYRNAVKLKSVYVDQLPQYVNPKTGRLHTHYSQIWTATGRIQSNNPNLQTIPVRKEKGREIRAAFIPRNEDYLLLAADYSQIELRIMAELSKDEAMLEAFTSGTDIHQVTAAKVYKVALDEVTREMRDKAKTVNFGIIYGISAFGLQQRLNIPRKEASQLIDNYFAEYPAVRAYIDRTIEFAQEHGYVKTQTGRRRYLRDINSRSRSMRSAAERLAMNSPIQGTAADMLKMAMIKVHRALREGGCQSKMLLTVHDEIVFDMHRHEQSTVMPIIEECMKTALPMRVPIVVEMGVGKTWLEAH